MMAFLKSMVAPTLLMGWATYYFIEVMGKPESARTLILPAYILLVVFYVAIVVRDYRRNRKAVDVSDPAQNGAHRENRIRCLCLAASALYLAAMPYLGFPVATVLALTFAFHILGAKRKIASLLFAICFTAILYYTFSHLLYVPLPLGLLEALRGY